MDRIEVDTAACLSKGMTYIASNCEAHQRNPYILLIEIGKTL